MGEATRSIPAREERESVPARVSHSQSALLEACRAMLPLVRAHCAGTGEGDAAISAAERAIARAEKEFPRSWKGHAQPKSGFFGRIGNHYDFSISVARVQERLRFYRLEGSDRLGRRVVVRVRKGDEPLSAEGGASVFLRGRVLAHRTLFGEPVTYIEATSGVLKV